MKVLTTSFFIENHLDSIHAAIAQQIRETRQSSSTRKIEIDGIRHLLNASGRFLYKLQLSTPIHLSDDQVLQFRTRNTKESITATVVSSDDEGITIESRQPLPTDARLIDVTFDPAFIYRALDDFLVGASPSPVAREFLRRELISPPRLKSKIRSGLNHEQSVAIDEMNTVPVHLLWGPPGTGKTTTIGVAVVEWLRAGKSVLVVTTSNAAVDVAIRAILKQSTKRDRQRILRLGTSTDPEVREVTMAGKLQQMDQGTSSHADRAQEQLMRITEQLSSRTNSNQRFHELLAEAAELEAIVNVANQRCDQLLPQVTNDVRVIGCTLAKMVLDPHVKERRFDVVIVDEASMVPVVCALAASTLATEHLILAGDPKQLPSICQSGKSDAKRWFGANCYDWYGMRAGRDEFDPSSFSFLQSQYRMTDEIGGVVSRLSYGDSLRHQRGDRGSRVQWVDVPDEWHENFYSVSDKSYFQCGSIPLIDRLAERLPESDELLLLTPFRPQRSILAALAYDLRNRFPGRKFTASTIHRAQGAESRSVILDLTTHRIDKLVAFFRDELCANLLNVGMSRARDRLIILGNRRLVSVLAREHSFWEHFLTELDDGIEVVAGRNVLDASIDNEELARRVGESTAKEEPCLYCCEAGRNPSKRLVTALRQTQATRRLMVVQHEGSRFDETDLLVRHSKDLPSVFVANGHVALPLAGGWVPTRAPNVARVLWRIGFSHLAEQEIDPMRAKRFFCPECASGELQIKRVGGDGWFLVCSNRRTRECWHQRRLTLEDAKLKVRLMGMTCSEGHPLTARQSGKGIFLGCENYPTCDYRENLSLIAEV